jgi:hypothetical protein
MILSRRPFHESGVLDIELPPSYVSALALRACEQSSIDGLELRLIGRKTWKHWSIDTSIEYPGIADTDFLAAI